MTIAIYVRVARKEVSNMAIEAQLNSCRELAASLSASNIIVYIDDGYSGIELDRPGLNSMLLDAQNKQIDTVITYDPSRLARDYAGVLTLIDEFDLAGVNIQYVVSSQRTDYRQGVARLLHDINAGTIIDDTRDFNKTVDSTEQEKSLEESLLSLMRALYSKRGA